MLRTQILVGKKTGRRSSFLFKFQADMSEFNAQVCSIHNQNYKTSGSCDNSTDTLENYDPPHQSIMGQTACFLI